MEVTACIRLPGRIKDGSPENQQFVLQWNPM